MIALFFILLKNIRKQIVYVFLEVKEQKLHQYRFK